MVAYHEVQRFTLPNVQNVQEFIRAVNSYWPDVVMSKSGQKAGTGRVPKCPSSKWLEDEVDTGQSSQRLKRPDVKLASGRKCQRFN